MISRSLGTLGFSLSVVAALVVSAPQARAVPVEIDLTITFIPPDPIVPGGPPIFQDLTGTATFYIPPSPVLSGFVSIGTLIPPSPIIPPSPVYTDSIIPVEPCIGAGTCQVSFSFGGTSSGFPAFAFLPNTFPSASPGSPPIIPIGIFAPGDPCFGAGVCHASGPIFAFDDTFAVGTWDVTIQAQTPLPGALPLFASGLGALGIIGWRRKRKASA